MATKSSDFPSESWFSHSQGSEVVGLDSKRHEKNLAYQVMTLFMDFLRDFGSSAMDIETSSEETPAHPVLRLCSSLSSNYCGTSASKRPKAGK